MHGILIGLAVLAGAEASELDIHDAYSPLNAQRPKRSETRLLVLHTTEGGDASAQRIVRRLGLANYLVLRTGRVLRIIGRSREARHAGTSMWEGTEDLDRVSIGIEVVGHHDRPITDAQVDALRELIEQLQRIYHLGDEAVVPHSMVAYGKANRWHDHDHRGRKRCGMRFARTDLRERIGLESRPDHDPDVKAGRLVEADPELAAALYGIPIDRGQTAAEVVGEAYEAASTVYVLPGGRSQRGDEIEDWSAIPAGTWVLLDQG